MNRLLPCVALLSLASSASAVTYTVSGQITDAAGDPIGNIAVEVWEDELWPVPDYPRFTTFTDTAGNYSFVAEEGTDPFVKVFWTMPLGANFGGRYLVFQGTGSGSAGAYSVATPYAPWTSATIDDISRNTTLSHAMGAAQPPPAPVFAGGALTAPSGMSNIHTNVMLTLDYVRTNKNAGTAWSFEHDIPVYVTSTAKGSWQKAGALYLEEPDFEDPVAPPNKRGAGDIMHETGHAIHYYIGMPAGSCGPSHTLKSENGPPCALREAWGNFLAL